jgi:hypothetical protein
MFRIGTIPRVTWLRSLLAVMVQWDLRGFEYPLSLQRGGRRHFIMYGQALEFAEPLKGALPEQKGVQIVSDAAGRSDHTRLPDLPLRDADQRMDRDVCTPSECGVTSNTARRCRLVAEPSLGSGSTAYDQYQSQVLAA